MLLLKSYLSFKHIVFFNFLNNILYSFIYLLYYFFISLLFSFVCVTGVLPVTHSKRQPADRLTVHCTKVKPKQQAFPNLPCCLEKNSKLFQTHCFQATLQQALQRLHSS